MRRSVWFIAAVLLLFSGSTALAAIRMGSVTPAANIYVATTGNDSNPGTLASPVLTIGKAKTLAQSYISVGICPTINFRGGTYPVASTLSFGTADSGPCPTVWQSYPSETAVWSGGTALTGTFTLCVTADSICNSGANDVWQSTATLTAFRELYVNGTHRLRARGSIAPAGWSITAGGYVSGTNMSTWGNPTNIEIVTASGSPTSASQPGWQQVRCTIASIAGTAVTMATPCWTLFKTYSTLYGAALPWYVENAYELLTTAGQHYYNRTTHILYYKRNGENMATVPVVVPQTVGFISAANVFNLTFSRLTFAYEAFNPDVGGDDYIPLQNGFYCTGVQNCDGNAHVGNVTALHSAIAVTGASHNLVFDHNLFTHLAARSLTFGHGAQNVTITANVFADNGGGAVIWDDGQAPGETSPALQTAGLIFRNNELHGPFEYEDSGGLYVLYSRDVLVDHNYFLDNPWVSVSYAWIQSTYNQNIVYSNNLTENMCQKFWDCGHFYDDAHLVTGGRAVTGNYSHDTTGTIPYLACYYLDLGTKLDNFHDNVCDPAPSALHFVFIAGAFGFIGTSNTIVSNFTTNASVVDNGTANTISGNTTYTSGSPPAGASAIIANAGIQAGVTPGP